MHINAPPAVEYDSHLFMLRRTIPALPFHILLWVAALFNALAGAPSHEARHIQDSVQSAEAFATAGNLHTRASTPTAHDEHSEEAHTTCAWCLTHALEAGLAHTPARPPQVPAAPSHIAAHGADPLPAQHVRWPFAVRDPPPAGQA